METSVFNQDQNLRLNLAIAPGTMKLKMLHVDPISTYSVALHVRYDVWHG